MHSTTLALPVLALSLAIAACGGGGSSNFEPPPPEPPAASCDAPTLVAGFTSQPAAPSAPPPAVGVQQVFTSLSFSQPLAMLQAPGDASRWFVVERRGAIRVFPDDPDATMADVETFADLSNMVDSGPGEAGLLGMAFHPDFQNNGEVYLSYTRGPALQSVVSCFLVNAADGRLDVSSEEVLLTLDQPQGNHNGGNIVFGWDGYLYVGFGDGGGAGDPGENGQDPANIFGTISRIDIGGPGDYAIPDDNPFAGNTECRQGSSSGTMPCPEIFAFGFRNPWRFSFDRQTGELWVGDVGQNTWEEIDRVESSMNYGWDEREGAHCFEPLDGCDTNNIDPITEYSHSLGSSVTGGYVYRGSDVAGLNGYYVFGDFGSGRIFAVPFDSPIGTPAVELVDTALNISSFAEGTNGELYILDYGAGTLHRLVAN